MDACFHQTPIRRSFTSTVRLRQARSNQYHRQHPLAWLAVGSSRTKATKRGIALTRVRPMEEL
jgi:hypothetical protein